jgi:hypothetical protein
LPLDLTPYPSPLERGKIQEAPPGKERGLGWGCIQNLTVLPPSEANLPTEKKLGNACVSTNKYSIKFYLFILRICLLSYQILF